MAIVPTRRQHYTVRSLLALVALVTTALVVPALADGAAGAPRTAPHAAPHATPHKQPTIGDVQKQLNQLSQKNSQVVEQFNHARIVVAASQKAAAAASAAAKVATARYQAVSAQFTQIVQAQYENGAMSEAGALLDSESGTNYLDRLNTLDLISAHDADVVSTMKQEKAAASAASAAAAKALAAAKAQRKALADKRDAVQAQISKYETLLATLTIQQQQAFSRSINPAVSAKALLTLQKNLNGAGSPAAQRAVRYALAQVGKPYVFGAAGPSSFDCSGLTMAAWQRGGVSLPHSAADQYNYGTHVSLNQLTPGDLIFFYHPIGHVTIYAGNGMMVSAPTEGEPVTVVSVQSFASDIVGATHLR